MRENDTLVATVGGLHGGSYATLESEGLATLNVENKGATFRDVKEQFETEYSSKKQQYEFKYFIGDQEITSTSDE